MHPLPHTRSCFVCGEANPAGLRLRFHTDRRLVSARFVPGPEHVGFKRTVHGGLTATVLDEAMVWACAVRTRQFTYCAELNVRYRQPVRPGETLTVEAELVEDRRGKIFLARAELRNADAVALATATGKYLPVPTAETTGMWDDFVGDAREALAQIWLESGEAAATTGLP